MDIKEDEIKEISKLGSLNGSEVKLITLKGGFHIGVGKTKEDSKTADILAVGSHPALISYQIQKKFDKKFEETLNKNENHPCHEVTDYSNNLDHKENEQLGLDIYAIKTNQDIDFKLTKHNFEIFSIKACVEGKELVLNKSTKNAEQLKSLNKKEISKKIEKSIKDFAKANKLKIKKQF